MGEREAKVLDAQLARRGSDRPHPFKQADAFRTCRICGLPGPHKVHDVPPDATQELDVKESSDASPDLSHEKPGPPHPEAMPKVGELRRCPQCRKVNMSTDLSCYWCHEKLPPTPAL